MINKLKSKKAFTIIEVVLVLGIAGLILLAVFIAVPALQRNKRNQIRKDDMARIMNAIVSYQGSHSGKVPIYFKNDGTSTYCSTLSTADGQKNCFFMNENFVPKFIDGNAILDEGPLNYGGNEYHYKCDENCPDFTDPDGTIYKLKAEGLYYSKGHEQLNEFDHVIHLAAYSKCASTTSDSSDGTGTVARTNDANDVTIVYRLEGSQAVFCIDNQ